MAKSYRQRVAELIDDHMAESLDGDLRVEATGETIYDALIEAGWRIIRGK